MIDNQAIEAMSEMLSMIKKFAKNAYPEVQTDASQANRQCAWIITRLLSRIAEHAADSDFEVLLADDVRRTYSEREKCAHAAKRSDRAFMLALHEFKEMAEKFKNSPVEGQHRTDGDIVRCLENLRPQRDALRARRADFADKLRLTVSKKESKETAAQLAFVEQKLYDVEEKLAAAETLAASRRIVVSFNRYRTVIERVENGAKMKNSGTKASQSAKPIENLMAI
jgi:hypothetical protein